MGHRAQELKAVTLLLQGIICRAVAKNLVGNHLHLALVHFGCNNNTGHLNAATDHKSGIYLYIHILLIDNQLQVSGAGAVVDFNKRNVFRVAGGSDPTAYVNGFSNVFIHVCKYFFDVNVFHSKIPFTKRIGEKFFLHSINCITFFGSCQ